MIVGRRARLLWLLVSALLRLRVEFSSGASVFFYAFESLLRLLPCVCVGSIPQLALLVKRFAHSLPREAEAGLITFAPPPSFIITPQEVAEILSLRTLRVDWRPFVAFSIQRTLSKLESQFYCVCVLRRQP